MREIKFRAWDGSEMEYDIAVGRHSKDGETADNSVVILDDGCVSFPHDPFGAIMQFTGLLDKNGTEIYEGDVWKVYSGKIFRPGQPPEINYIHGVVTFNHNGACIKGVYHVLPGQGEVIGNIHENPELLKEAE